MLARDRSAYQKEFKLRGKIEATFTDFTLKIDGDHATVKAGQRVVFVVHGMTSQNSATILFSLEKTQGHWLITSME